MSALEATLFRRDGGTSTFDLPAYRELLFLFSVARDLAESETPSSGVDLLLPIGGDMSGPASLTLLRATPPAAVGRAPCTKVDVDITGFDAGPPDEDEHPSRFRTDFSATSGSAALSVEPSVTRH